FPGQVTPLPQVTGPIPQPQVEPRPRPVMPNVAPTEIPVENTADLGAQAQTRARNIQQYTDNQARMAAELQRQQEQAATNRAAAQQEVLHGTSLDQAARDAAAQRAHKAP